MQKKALLLLAPAAALLAALACDDGGGGGEGPPPSPCGNGVLDDGERCDGDCPESCDDGFACTADVLEGSAATCDARCTHAAITACGEADGCCAAGCDAEGDADCSPTCGDAVRDAGETCDPPGSCPTSCDDGDVCTAEALVGEAAACSAECWVRTITECVPRDGCCPAGCTVETDADCAFECGNGVRETGELCDGEDCPTSCDDGSACTADTLEGSAATCDAVCVNEPVTACSATRDGCCPAGCSITTDADCGFDCRDPDTWPAEWKQFEDEVLELVNVERAAGAICGGQPKAPVGPLHMDELLRAAARCHSQDMGRRNFFDHVNPTGEDPFDRIAEEGYTAMPQGENIAAGQGSPREVVDGWMDSPGHCVNIMEGGFQAIGVGFADVPRGAYRTYWTQTFGGR